MLLITGSNGLLGSKFREKLSADKAYFATRQDMDITDIDSIRRYLRGKNITTIVNCAACKDAEGLEGDLEKALALNTEGPRNIALVAGEIGAAIIHYSSDYVFDGRKNTPYTEEDETNPVSVYGKTKLAGDLAVLENAGTAVILRASWFFSDSPDTFVGKIIHAASQRKEISVVYDQVGSPCAVDDLVDHTLTIIPKIAQGSKEVYHLSNHGVCSWYDIAHYIVRKMEIDCKVVPILSSAFPLKAKRPSYSVLDKTKILSAFGLDIRHYDILLDEYLLKMKERIS